GFVRRLGEKVPVSRCVPSGVPAESVRNRPIIPWQQGRTSIQGQALYRALCEADCPDSKCPGCFASLRSEQGAAPLAPLCDYPCALPVNGQFCKDRCYLWTSTGKARRIKEFTV